MTAERSANPAFLKPRARCHVHQKNPLGWPLQRLSGLVFHRILGRQSLCSDIHGSIILPHACCSKSCRSVLPAGAPSLNMRPASREVIFSPLPVCLRKNSACICHCLPRIGADSTLITGSSSKSSSPISDRQSQSALYLFDMPHLLLAPWPTVLWYGWHSQRPASFSQVGLPLDSYRLCSYSIRSSY